MRMMRLRDGFSLPAMLVLSIVILTVLLSLLQNSSTLLTITQSRHYMRLAEQAAEAGTSYAASCLEASGHVQTWGPAASKPNLTPQTDCSGATIGGYPSSVYTRTGLTTTYSVGDLDSNLGDSVQISATGTATVGAGGSTKTYTSLVKKTLTWDPTLSSQQSTSGTLRTCGILSNSTYCWGRNQYGQLGNGMTTDSLIPVKVKRDPYPSGIGAYKITHMVSGGYFNCVVIETGEAYCWGRNNQGQLGNNSTTDSSVPVKVTGLTGKNIVKLGVTSNAACALTDGGELYCWGSNSSGQVGNNKSSNSLALTPVLIGGPSGGFGGLANKTVSYVSTSGAFNTHICAIASLVAYCWGSNQDGELGINVMPTGTNATNKAIVPTAVYTGGVLSGKKVIAITGDGNAYYEPGLSGNVAQGNAHTCAIAYTTTTADALAYCWGSNLDGGLGNNGTMGLSSNTFPAWLYIAPQAVSTSGVLSGRTPVEVGTSAAGGCVTAYTGGDINTSRAYCWGASTTRGDGSTGRTAVPVAVTDTYIPSVFANNRIYGLTGGAVRMCAIANNISYCWGANGDGQIGTGSTTPSTVRQPRDAIFLHPLSNQYVY
jgi:alpha-tubulin suppressor-like RCC1 family protein